MALPWDPSIRTEKDRPIARNQIRIHLQSVALCRAAICATLVFMLNPQPENDPLFLPPRPNRWSGPLTEPPPRIFECRDARGQVLLTLQAAGERDYILFYQVINDPTLNQFQCRVGDMLDTSGNGITQNELAKFLRHVENSFDKNVSEPALWQWVAFNTANTPVGFVELSTVCEGEGQKGVNPSALMLGFTILGNHQRKGYASTAAKHLVEWARSVDTVKEIQGWCHPQNEASQTLNANLGMKLCRDAEERFRFFPMLNESVRMQVWSLSLTRKADES